jgi:ankyrin repeat protein
VRYCGVDHQKQHWPMHKSFCKEIVLRFTNDAQENQKLNELFETCLDLLKINNISQFKKIIQENQNLVNFQCEEEMGATLLFPSAAWNKLDAVKILIDAGVNVNIRDKEGFTALFLAVRESNIPIVNIEMRHIPPHLLPGSLQILNNNIMHINRITNIIVYSSWIIIPSNYKKGRIKNFNI